MDPNLTAYFDLARRLRALEGQQQAAHSATGVATSTPAPGTTPVDSQTEASIITNFPEDYNTILAAFESVNSAMAALANDSSVLSTHMQNVLSI